MQSTTIRQRILLSFGLILALMFAMGAAALLYTEQIRAGVYQSRTDSLPGITHSSALLLAALDDQLLTVRHVIASDKEEMRRLGAQIQEARMRVAEALRSYE